MVRMEFLKRQIINAHKGSRWHLPNSGALFYLCCLERWISFPLPVGGKMASICFEPGFPVYFNAVSYSVVAIFALAEVIFHRGSGPHVSVPQLNRLKLQSVRCPRPKSQQGLPEGHRGSRSDRNGHHPNCLPHHATAHKQCRVPTPPACVFLCVWPLAFITCTMTHFNIRPKHNRFTDRYCLIPSKLHLINRMRNSTQVHSLNALYIEVTCLALSNNERDTSITDTAVSSEVILGVFLSHGSASSVTDDLHINSVWAELCGPGEKERERESKKRKEGRGLHPSVLAITKDIWHIESRSSSYHMCLSWTVSQIVLFLSMHTMLITCAHSTTTYCWTGFLATSTSRIYSLTLFDIIWHMTSF